jgi:cytochrome c oxidase subunit III
MPEAVATPKLLPVGAAGKRSSGWWGVCMLIATEASLFGYLLVSYYYLWAQTGQHWPPEGLPKLMTSGINTVILLSSSVFFWLAERCIRKNRTTGTMAWLAIAIIAGAAFIAIQLREWHNKPYGLTTNLYGSLYFTITGFHLLHVAVGLVILILLLLWTRLGYFDARRCEAISIGGLYWHFVDAVWLFIFSSFFLVPYLGGPR